MFVKLLFGGAFGAIFGAGAGWLAFNTVTSAVGFGCAIASGICGVMLSSTFTDD